MKKEPKSIEEKQSPAEKAFWELWLQLNELQGHNPIREHRFSTVSTWRFDFAWPHRKIAVEIEGGTWSGGRHTRGKGFEGDCRKYNQATVEGWRVLRYTPQMFKADPVIIIRQIEALINGRSS